MRGSTGCGDKDNGTLARGTVPRQGPSMETSRCCGIGEVLTTQSARASDNSACRLSEDHLTHRNDDQRTRPTESFKDARGMLRTLGPSMAESIERWKRWCGDDGWLPSTEGTTAGG
ncbi:hypothetical protein NL676_021664 [Syzygium grande]|nr:hypothetical protein NL676_021664 [Syzygium grande]